MRFDAAVGRVHRGGPPTVTAAVLLALAATSACSHDSYLVITLLSGDTAFSQISAVEVTVTAPGRPPKTLVPDYDASRFSTFDTQTGPRLSIAFTPDSAEPVDVVVIVKTASDPCLGRGVAQSVPLTRGGTSRVEVQIFHVIGACPGTGNRSDAGTDASGQLTFPGCDPAALTSCPATQACFVDCTAQAATCVAGGTRGVGERCASNLDCAPGTECFDFSTLSGCSASTKICLRFCALDADCAPAAPASPADSGAGAGPDAAATASYSYPGGACRTAVECPGAEVTSYHRCSFGCDPRGDGRTGCPDGLFCFLFRNSAGGDSPDCGCKDASRVGTDGAPCTTSVSCAPGFICNQTGTVQVCRQLCKPGTASADCGTKSCTALSNNPDFGVCL